MCYWGHYSTPYGTQGSINRLLHFQDALKWQYNNISIIDTTLKINCVDQLHWKHIHTCKNVLWPGGNLLIFKIYIGMELKLHLYDGTDSIHFISSRGFM